MMNFSPSSIAIVGASANPLKVGYLVLKNLLEQGYKGEIFLVNKNGGKILGKKVYCALSEIGKKIDLVVLAIPVDQVLSIIDEVGYLSIKNLIVFAAGFKETGQEGKKKEDILKAKVEKYQIDLLGPNCVGFINTKDYINLTFLKGKAKKGNIGIISQSGALGSYIIDYFNKKESLGFSYFFSLGNKTKIDEIDLLKFLAENKETKVIGCYFESIDNGEKFKNEIKKITARKPVIILKPGKSAQASKAASSHTGSMVGDNDVYQAVFSQSGVIKAESLDEFLLFLKIFSFEKVPNNSRFLVLTNAGGVGVMFVDELVSNNLELVTISKQTKDKILKKLPNASRISIHNPIDLLGDAQAQDFSIVFDESLKEKNFNATVVLLTPQANTNVEKITDVIIHFQKKTNLPIFPVYLGGEAVDKSLDKLDKERIVGLSSFSFLPKTLRKILDYQHFLTNFKKTKDGFCFNIKKEKNYQIKKILKENRLDFLSVSKSLEVFKILDLPVVDFFKVNNQKDIENLRGKMNFPLVAKIDSDKISHKTDFKGVILGIDCFLNLKKAYESLSKIYPSVIFQKMVKGNEFIIGTKKDNIFGTVVIFGLGGIHTEVLSEIIRLVFPFTFNDFIFSLSKKRWSKILQGFRGEKPVDLKQIFEILYKVGYFASFFDIKEIDINPLMIKDGVLNIVDGRILIK